jgi:hypothetical protein
MWYLLWLCCVRGVLVLYSDANSDYTTRCKSQSWDPEDRQKTAPKHVELIEGSINLLLLHLVGYQYYLFSFVTTDS